MWILYVLFYGLMKGGRDVIKKIALNKNTFIEILIAHTGLSLLMVLPTAGDAFEMDSRFFIYIAIKSFVIFLAWILSFKAIKKLPVSIVGLIDLSRVLFATLLGVLILGEVMKVSQYVGLAMVCAGLLLLKKFSTTSVDSKEHEDIKTVYVVMALLSCILNATSGLMDKILMKDISSSQLQFWYMLFIFIYYIIFAIITRAKISVSVLKNGWIWLLSIIFVLADKALFIANADPASRVTVMTLIKQSCCIVTIIGGRLIFKEKNIAKKLMCAAIIIFGIMIGIMN